MASVFNSSDVLPPCLRRRLAVSECLRKMALLGQSEDQVALATPEDWYVGSIDPTDIFHKTTRVLKELAATGKSKKVAADSLKSLREFWDKASKQFNDSQMDIQ